ncbi:MAG: hypothetical protein IKF14_10610 [Atopobiaceae bacterium]|nr:hypothetical protein [Atopobiaceae bacterium]
MTSDGTYGTDETGETDGESASATTEQAIPIYDIDGLLALASNPSGSFKLMADIDLAGHTWQPFDFRGTLDGNGHAILNATITEVSAARRDTYDGNLVSYESVFSGFFGALEGATVRNVQFLGLDVSAKTEEPTFVGGVCGYMDDATIENCTIVGQVALTTTGSCIGVGGAAGFGRGTIANNIIDVTLVCTDTDKVNKDEQFMGGAYANGYADLKNNKITIHGYVSDHGYVHSGGMIGMYILYPEDYGYAGTITDNNVEGSISFFEDNTDRRAYCDAEIGENMSPSNITRSGNTSNFTPDEHFEYDVDLVPHACENPEWTDDVHEGSCTEHGYTEKTCSTCGYKYRTAWMPIKHNVETWKDVTDPTATSGAATTAAGTATTTDATKVTTDTQTTGSETATSEAATSEASSSQTASTTSAASDGSVIREGTCTICGATVYERVTADVVAAEEAATAEAEAEAAKTTAATVGVSRKAAAIALGVAVLLVALAGGLLAFAHRRK